MPTWVITGCSTGLGRALSQAVLERGYNAVITAREVATVQGLVAAHMDTALALALDVTDHAQVARAVQQAEERFGGPRSRRATSPRSPSCSPPTSSARSR
jgi:NAD(P)-dependent dehydrogenase (short-subunit alcohol dehydrogenase family)